MTKAFQGLITMVVLVLSRQCVSDIPTGEELFFEQQTTARAIEVFEYPESPDRLMSDESAPPPQADPFMLT